MTSHAPPPISDTESQRLADSVTRLLEDDRAALLMAQPFVAILAMQLPIVSVSGPQLPTVATDGDRLYVNPGFIGSLNAAERRFVLAHCIWHCALLHPWRRGERRGARWDLAVDHEVNAILQDTMTLPQGVVLFDEFVEQSAEQAYRALEQSGVDRDRGRLADVHSMGRSEPEASPIPVGSAPGADSRSASWSASITSSTERVWAERVLAAARQTTRVGGHVPGCIERIIRRLMHPPLPWQALLSQFVTMAASNARTWLPPSRRHLHRGLYLPSRRSPLLRLAVALDTSASTEAFQPALLAELSGIVRSYSRFELSLVQGDARVQNVTTYSHDRPPDPSSLPVRGFGGTDFRPIFDYLDSRDAPAPLVFLTDGRGDAPRQPPRYPVLWVLSGEGRAPAAWGTVVHLRPEASG